ncbi:MAG: hypothetical protein EA369_07065 [Bradymonadales bacterium]|nr:MAG: hypothetical protein EA369_07065 [Bradymonadales bacterium]
MPSTSSRAFRDGLLRLERSESREVLGALVSLWNQKYSKKITGIGIDLCDFDVLTYGMHPDFICRTVEYISYLEEPVNVGR